MKPLLLLPVENQVRELDAKLLVGCVAAQRGYTSLVGWKGLIDRRIGRFPPSVYFAKSISEQNAKMLRIKRKLGHYVVAWDEEAVVHYPPAIYYARRVAADALELVDVMVVWGEDNRELLLGHPACKEERLRVLGNPRADLLRPEMRDLFAERVRGLNEAHGEFILVNTNFGSVNGYTDRLNLMREEDGRWIPGRGALGMPVEYAEGLFAYRRRVFESFKTLIPRLADAFPERRVVLRPHPAEDHDSWRQLLAPHPNVRVLSDGNVVPWLLACSCLVHNGCTTAVEGFALGTRVVSFVPEEDERYEFHLPNRLGERCSTPDEVIKAVAHPCADADPTGERAKLLRRHIHQDADELAAARVLSVVPEYPPGANWTRFPLRTWGRVHAELRSAVKRVQRSLGIARYSDGFMRQRFPELRVETVQAKADQICAVLKAAGRVRVRERERDLFEVTRAVGTSG